MVSYLHNRYTGDKIDYIREQIAPTVLFNPLPLPPFDVPWLAAPTNPIVNAKRSSLMFIDANNLVQGLAAAWTKLVHV